MLKKMKTDVHGLFFLEINFYFTNLKYFEIVSFLSFSKVSEKNIHYYGRKVGYGKYYIPLRKFCLNKKKLFLCVVRRKLKGVEKSGFCHCLIFAIS